jgi:hypothetical protein
MKILLHLAAVSIRINISGIFCKFQEIRRTGITKGRPCSAEQPKSYFKREKRRSNKEKGGRAAEKREPWRRRGG